MSAVVTLKKGEGRMVKSGGMWIFDNEIESVMGTFENGDLVLVHDFDGYPMGIGFINRNSKIRVRLFSRKEDTVIDEAFFRTRLQQAWEYRKKTVDTSSCRVVFGEADFLPGLVIDKFSDVLVVQSLALGIDRYKELIVKCLKEILAEDGITYHLHPGDFILLDPDKYHEGKQITYCEYYYIHFQHETIHLMTHPMLEESENNHAKSIDKVLEKWENIKVQERGDKRVTSRMEKVPKALPALTRANKIQKRAAESGFDWDDISGAFDKVKEEYREVISCCQDENKDAARLKEEVGDLLFSVVNISRFLGIDPEDALNYTNNKFIRRFSHIEKTALACGRELEEMSLSEMDELWNEAKKLEHSV